MVVPISTRPQPDGHTFAHSLLGHCARQPDERYTDAVLDLQRLETGNHGLPMVVAWEADDGTWGVEVTLWSTNARPDSSEVSALEGTLAEVLASVRV